jgi:phosphatidate cytidylyltransferase
MAPSPDRNPDRRVLLLRILSSLVLGPLALAVVWFGYPAFDLLLLLAGVLMAREWTDLVAGGAHRIMMMLLAGVVLWLSLLGLAVGASLVAALLAAAIVLLVARFKGSRFDPAAGHATSVWLAGGLLVATVPCIAFGWLRNEPTNGAAIIFWILGVAWATDIGAFAFGRLIGGPKLAPRVSPNKTWAGSIGGLASAIAVGLGLGIGAASLAGFARPDLTLLVVASAVASVVGQAGDLAESAAKRRFGAKDSGHLIPGHGGLLDRVDSLLAIAPIVALVVGLVHPNAMLS